MTLLEAALQYHALGLHPVPLEPRGKRPRVEWKDYQETQPTADQVRAWWAQQPDANIGLVLGRGTFALDIDGAAGWAALEAADVKVHELMTATSAMVATGKGHHLYYTGRVPDRVAVLPSVDVRGVGYVVAPPSVHQTGRIYEWVGGIRPFPPAPAKLLALIERKQAAPAELNGGSWVTDALGGVTEGGRDATCTRLAGYLWGKGLPQEVVESLLQQWALRCTPAFEPDQVTKCVESIVKREGGPATPPAILREALTATLAELFEPKQTRKDMVNTGFGKFDELVSLNAELVYLGARPSVGKTALALYLARREAMKGNGVLFVTREMTQTQLTRRLLAMESGVPLRDLKRGELLDFQKSAVRDAAKRMENLPLWITHDLKSPHAIDEALQVYEPGMLKLVIVDYLQLLRSDSGIRESRQRVEESSQGLKDLVVKHDLPFLVLSSLSRPPKDKPNWTPSLWDLRESGELEHDADMVWLMHRPDLTLPMTTLTVAKNRDGELGTQHLLFDGARMEFKEVAL